MFVDFSMVSCYENSFKKHYSWSKRSLTSKCEGTRVHFIAWRIMLTWITWLITYNFLQKVYSICLRRIIDAGGISSSHLFYAPLLDGMLLLQPSGTFPEILDSSKKHLYCYAVFLQQTIDLENGFEGGWWEIMELLSALRNLKPKSTGGWALWVTSKMELISFLFVCF